MDTAGMFGQHLQRLGAVRRLEDRVAVAQEDLLGHEAHRRLVVHQQDRLSAAGFRRRLRHGRAGHRCRGGLPRQVDAERGPDAGLAGRPDEAAALFHDTIGHRQPEADAVHAGFGGEEWLEDLRERRLVHADAGVGDHDPAVAPGRHGSAVPHVRVGQIFGPRGDRQTAAIRHRIARVGYQDLNRLLELSGINPHQPALALPPRLREPQVQVDLAAQERQHPRFHL